MVVMLLLIAAQAVYAQSIEEIDHKLATYLDRLACWSAHSNKDTTVSRRDSLASINYSIASYIEHVCHKKPVSVLKSLPKAGERGLTVMASDDDKLLLFSWDTKMGGTMRYYDDIVQYTAGNTLKVAHMVDTSVDGDYGSDYMNITTIHTTSNKTVYLVQDYCIISTNDRSESITAYTIEHGVLKTADMFKTKTQLLDDIEYHYDAFASMKKYPGKDIARVHLSDDSKKLFIPIVNGKYGDVVSDRYLVYVFDGTYFVFDKNAQ
jgi:hypothetical protein